MGSSSLDIATITTCPPINNKFKIIQNTNKQQLPTEFYLNYWLHFDNAYLSTANFSHDRLISISYKILIVKQNNYSLLKILLKILYFQIVLKVFFYDQA